MKRVSTSPVTVAITRRVRHGDDTLMQAWVGAGIRLAERHPGFLGAGSVQSDTDSDSWHMLYRFDSPETLQNWESSRERRLWLASGEELVEITRREHRTGIEGWFDEPQERSVTEPGPSAPPVWKQGVVIWCAFFPTSVLLTYALARPTEGWWPVFRVLLTTLIAVPWMTYFLLPRVTAWFQPWLTGRRRRIPRPGA